MDDTLTKVLRMTFAIEVGGAVVKKKSIRLANPKDNLDGKEVHSFMKIVADNKMFWCQGKGEGISLRPLSAKIVTTDTKQVELVSVDE